MNPVNTNGPLHGARPVHTEEQQENETQQNNAAQQPKKSKKNNKPKRFTIIRKASKLVGNSLTPISVASAIAIRDILINGLYMSRSINIENASLSQCWNIGSTSLIPSALGFIGAIAIKKNVYKIIERKQNKELSIPQKIGVNAAIIASGAILTMTTYLINLSTFFPLDVFITMSAAVATGIARLFQKIKDKKTKKANTNEGPVK